MPRSPTRSTRAFVSVSTLGMLSALLTWPSPWTTPPAAAAPARSGSCSAGQVSLTFDDGPAGPTDRLVRVLRRAGVPATFFMVGQRVAAAPEVARRVERAGFLVANHSWAHADMRTQTSAQVEATLRSTQQALRRAGTHPTMLMRPPYGALDDAARVGIARAGFVPVLWTVDSRDWAGGTADQIADRILAGLRPNATNIVLQHDGVGRSPTSISAVPKVVRVARSRGYCFVALDEAGRPGFHTPDARVTVSGAREGRSAVATVRLARPPGRATSVLLRTTSRSATVGQDLDRVRRRVTVPAGKLAVRVKIPVSRDRTDEPTERFEVRISRPRGVRITDGDAVASITDIDPPPVVRGLDVEVVEPTADPATVTAQLVLSRPSGKQVSVVVATRHGTAGADDYVSRRERFVLEPGQTRVRIQVSVLPDELDEIEETFTVAVVRAKRVRVGPPSTVTILPPPPADPPVAPRRAGPRQQGGSTGAE